jgi:hypothetical protein
MLNNYYLKHEVIDPSIDFEQPKNFYYRSEKISKQNFTLWHASESFKKLLFLGKFQISQIFADQDEKMRNALQKVKICNSQLTRKFFRVPQMGIPWTPSATGSIFPEN